MLSETELAEATQVLEVSDEFLILLSRPTGAVLTQRPNQRPHLRVCLEDEVVELFVLVRGNIVELSNDVPILVRWHIIAVLTGLFRIYEVFKAIAHLLIE